MKNERKVFVIRGSEDGNIDVVSNMSKAYNSCFKYVSDNGESKFEVYESRSSFMNSLSKFGSGTLTSKNAEAHAERFYLN